MKFKFLSGLSDALQTEVLSQIRDLWTYSTNALEGSTLTLGETHFILKEGLTVSGKPIKDHLDAQGHAKALENVYSLLNKDEITEKDILDLHKLIITKDFIDSAKPVGDYKVDYNFTTYIDEDEEQHTIEYIAPYFSKGMIKKWIAELNNFLESDLSYEEAISAYTRLHMTFARIHPFYDGNGRMARLLANLPVLKSGHVPVIISNDLRQEYCSILGKYQYEIDNSSQIQDLLPDHPMIEAFRQFCNKGQEPVQKIIKNAQTLQKKINDKELKRNDSAPSLD